MCIRFKNIKILQYTIVLESGDILFKTRLGQLSKTGMCIDETYIRDHRLQATRGDRDGEPFV